MTKCVIVADPKGGHNDGKVIFLVDRQLDPNNWWTIDIAFAQIFRSAPQAQARVKGLKFNNARVMTLGAARAMVKNYDKTQQ